MENSILTWITFLPLVGSLAILFVPKTSTSAIKWVAGIFTCIPLVLATWLYFGLFDRNDAGIQFSHLTADGSIPMWIEMIGARYHVGVDGLSLALVWLTTLLLAIAVPASFGIQKSQKAYYALLLFLEVGIIGVFVALDFFLFYVYWEIMLLPMYFLIGIWGGPRREYAAIKFFLYTLAGSVLMLVAIVALRLDTAAVLDAMVAAGDAPAAVMEQVFSIPKMVELAGGVTGASGAEYALTGANLPGAGTLLGMQFSTWVFWFLFVGFAIKVPVFPFHTWLPDAHVQAPTPISVILAGILLKLGGYGMLRACFPLVPDAFHTFALTLGVLGVISIVYGAFVALGQSDFKRMVAYSSVSHMGYVLLGFAALTEYGMAGAATQMFNHGTSSAVLFLIVGVIYDRAHHRDLNGFGGLSQVMPRYWALTTFGFFAALGLPGLAGFVSEALTLVGAYQASDPAFRTLVFISLIGIVLTAAFLLWAMQRVFLGPLNEKYKDYGDINAREVVCMAPLLFLCLALGILPRYLLDYMEPSINALLQTLGAS